MSEGCGDCGDVLPGIFDAMDSDEGIQRCDECSVYDGDLDAALALADHVGGTAWFYTEDDEGVRTRRQYIGVAVDVCIAEGTNPWVEIDGNVVSWPDWKATKGGRS